MIDDFFRRRLDQTIDPRHPLAVLASRLPWDNMESRVAPLFAHKERPLQHIEESSDLAGSAVRISGGKARNAGCPRLAMRLTIALTPLKNSVDRSDEELVQRFAGRRPASSGRQREPTFGVGGLANSALHNERSASIAGIGKALHCTGGGLNLALCRFGC